VIANHDIISYVVYGVSERKLETHANDLKGVLLDLSGPWI
jgi:hypothetical protein